MSSYVQDPMLSLDDIIKIRKIRTGSRAPSVAGSSKSFGAVSVKSYRSQRSTGRQRNNAFYNNNQRVQQLQQRRNGFQSKWQFQRGGGGGFVRVYRQPRRFNYNQTLARQRVRRAANFLNVYPRQRQMTFQPYQFVNPGRWAQPQRNTYRIYTQRRPVINTYNQNVQQLRKMQPLRQRMNRTYMSGRQMQEDDTASVLTVSVANDMYQKRPQTRVPPLVDNALPRRNIGNLNQANVARHNAALGLTTNKRGVSPNGSIVTSVSQRSGNSSRSRRSRQRQRGRNQKRSASISNGLNPEIQRAIADIQGKSFTENGDRFARPTTPSVPVRSLHRPTAIATGISLHQRFSR